MQKRFFLLTSQLLFTLVLCAQYTTDWIRPADNYSKTGTMIVRDNLDNAIVTGYIQSQNIYTRKYDKSGNLQWEKTSASGLAGNYEKPVWINADSSNNIIVTGYRYSIGSGREYPNAMVIIKYDATGLLLWKKSIAISILVGNSISPFNLRSEVDLVGNLYIGTVTANPSGFNLYKLNAAGTILFTKSNSVNSPSGFNAMRLKGNKLVLTGRSGTKSAPVIAWDTNGNLLWTASFLGQGGNDVESDNAGNTYLLTSYANQVSSNSGQDMIVYKLNSNGSQVWKKNFHFGGYDYPTRFTCVADKISIIGYGSINSSYFDWITFQINTSGNMLWNTRYNRTLYNDEQPYFITAKASGEVFVTGKGGPRPDPNNLSSIRMITLKYDNAGNTKWVDSVDIYGGRGVACTLASDSSVYVLSSASMTTYHFLDHAPVYCATGGQSIANEWISTVSIEVSPSQPGSAFLLNNSFINTSGYSDFTNLSIALKPNDSVRVNVGTGTSVLGATLVRHYSAWIDYNQDKDFNDPGEQILNNSITVIGSIDFGFRMPATVMAGSARLRITMSHDDILSPCGAYPGGETEDYTAMIGTLAVAAAIPSRAESGWIKNNHQILKAYPNPFSEVLNIDLSLVEENSTISLYDVTGKLYRTFRVTGLHQELNLSGLMNGMYLLKITNGNQESQTLKVIKY